jgi:FkbM family methyltransferase
MTDVDPFCTYVLDAGGRYGIHPTWKKFSGDLRYYSFEPDPMEAQRLQKKYAGRQNSITVVEKALHSHIGLVKLHVLAHKGQSSLFRPNEGSDWFKSRPDEGRVNQEIDVETVTVDGYSEKNGIMFDFAKIDTEGNEFNILEGARSQLNESILGVRCEVNFELVYEGIVLFPKIHELMLNAGFYLVNLDYDGRGTARNGFVHCDKRYGILSGCDAVYLKRTELILNSTNDEKIVGSMALKCAAFCLANNASDVALDILLATRQNYPLAIAACEGSKLHTHVTIETQKLIKSIQYQPGQRVSELRELYTGLFGKQMKDWHEFYELIETN